MILLPRCVWRRMRRGEISAVSVWMHYIGFHFHCLPLPKHFKLSPFISIHLWLSITRLLSTIHTDIGLILLQNKLPNIFLYGNRLVHTHWASFWLVKLVVFLFKLIIILLKQPLWRATIDDVVMLKYKVPSMSGSHHAGLTCSCLIGRQREPA